MLNRTWFEVRVNGMSTRHSTLEEARHNKEQMKNGYPENDHMTPENKAFWIRQSQTREVELFKVSETYTKLS